MLFAGATDENRPVDWLERARAAEQLQDWDAAIALVSADVECFSDDPDRHDNHLWHMDLLVRAERIPELTELALRDRHALRRLNRSLRERGMESALRERAEEGDRDALYVLVRLMCETERMHEALKVIQDIDPENKYAHQIVASDCRP